MSEEIEKENTAAHRPGNLPGRNRAVYLAGLKTREIAKKVGQPGLNVGRNLRELKNRWARAAARQRAAPVPDPMRRHLPRSHASLVPLPAAKAHHHRANQRGRPNRLKPPSAAWKGRATRRS